jgi:hypothetical protein
MASSLECPFALMAEGNVSLSNGLMLALQARKRLVETLVQESALFQLFNDIQENRGRKSRLRASNKGKKGSRDGKRHYGSSTIDPGKAAVEAMACSAQDED